MCFCKKTQQEIEKIKKEKTGPSSPGFDERKYLLVDDLDNFDITKSSLYKRRTKKKYGQKS